MKKGILLIAIILGGLIGLAAAAEAEERATAEETAVEKPAIPAAPTDRISGTINLDYGTRYIWRGFDKYYNNHAAFQPNVDLKWFGTGFGTTIFYSTPFTGHLEDLQELDFTPYYENSIFNEEIYKINYKIWYTYYRYPRKAMSWNDAQEMGGSFGFPHILPWGIVPSYTFVYMWESTNGDSDDTRLFKNCDGPAHIFGLGYDLKTGPILPNTTEQVFHLTTDLVYNDGVGPGGSAVDHDWSNAVFGIATDVDLSNNLTFTPGFFLQKTMDHSINQNDEYWFTLRLSYAF